MEIFTVEERIFIVKQFYLGQCLEGVVTVFLENFHNRPAPSVNTVRRIIQNFETIGCVSPLHHKLPPQDNNEREEQEITICASVEENPDRSLNEIVDQVDVSRTTAHRVLRKHGYTSYKVQKMNQIFPEDLERRLVFCETIMERANNDDNFIKNIFFTDESTFPLLGHANPAVTRYWSLDNLHRTYVARTQYPQKLNVWAGILGDHVIGPLFIDGTLNGVKYLDLLQTQIIPALQQLGINLGDVWFQQDGCPAHNTAPVRECLERHFRNRVISGRGNILWPARSPDLTPADFFLWGYVKSTIYRFEDDRANNLDELRIEIRNCMQAISPETLARVRRDFYDRLGYCSAQEGGRFEHLI